MKIIIKISMITGMLLTVLLSVYQMFDILVLHLVVGLLNTLLLPVGTGTFKRELGYMMRCIASGIPLMAAMILNTFVKEGAKLLDK